MQLFRLYFSLNRIYASQELKTLFCVVFSPLYSVGLQTIEYATLYV